jgi:hypothetical protein
MQRQRNQLHTAQLQRGSFVQPFPLYSAGKQRDAQEAPENFYRTKHALISALVLSLPDPDLPYEVTAEAIKVAVALFWFKKDILLPTSEKNYNTGEQELLAQHDALLQWASEC